LSLPGGGAQNGHTDYQCEKENLLVLLALQEQTYYVDAQESVYKSSYTIVLLSRI